MVKVSGKDLIKLALPALVIGAMLIGGCVGKKIPAQIIKDITPQEAFALIQENQQNPDFVIIDVQTPEAFAQEHIENAINLDYGSQGFRDELDKLDKNKIYLIYCRNGTQSQSALDMMAELNFAEVYNISGGLDQWKEVGLATIQIPAQISESITAQEAFNLIQENQNFAIIDIQTSEAFAQEHIENAININYGSENFQEELDKLDKDKTYLIYYSCACGGIDKKALDTMKELGFKEVYKISGGLDQWKEEGLPTIQPKPAQISESITAQEAFNLIQEKQNDPNFVIIDIRTPEEFAQEHIENAININYGSENFQEELDKLDKDKTYLIYCRTGARSQSALDMMAELNFTEVYNISGGLDQWKQEGLPTIQEIPAQISESISAEEAFNLTQENQDNPNFIPIDIRTPEEFAQWHVKHAININYGSEDFRDKLDKLDKDKIYLIYYSCGCGGIDKKALDTMKELSFKEVYKISGGLTQQKWEGLQP